MRLVKCKILFLLICFSYLLVGCNKLTGPYKLAYSSQEIDSISIVLITDDVYDSNIQFETLYKVTEKEVFMEDFFEIIYKRFTFGDPTYLTSGDYAILVYYSIENYEFIGHYAQSVISNNVLHFGKYYCDEQDFLNFLKNYISLD